MYKNERHFGLDNAAAEERRAEERRQALRDRRVAQRRKQAWHRGEVQWPTTQGEARFLIKCLIIVVAAALIAALVVYLGHHG